MNKKEIEEVKEGVNQLIIEMVSSLIMAQDFEDIKNDLVGDLPTNGEIIVGENQLKMWE